jgi:radical SAM protein with 4Fe4S-binding SPASM domain
MVPEIDAPGVSMSSETFEKMLYVADSLIKKGEYSFIGFRLSGGEPLLVWENYADLITDCRRKSKPFGFGILSNLTKLTDDMVDWLKETKIGIQVSLDDMVDSKPFSNGESSSAAVLENIEKLRNAKVGFSINTVFDYTKTKSLYELVDYICSLGQIHWGLAPSLTLNDEVHIEEIVDVLKLGILRLRDNGFDVLNFLRVYNEVINKPGHSCSAGVGLVTLGTNLEVWPCQSLINTPPLGYFDEDIKTLLATSEANKYFYNRTLLPQCTDCDVLNWCRGGCRAVHLTDKKAVDVTCRIKQKIIPFILKEMYNNNRNGYRNYSTSNCGECHNHQLDGGLDDIIKEYILEHDKTGPMFVETPSLEENLE